MVISFQESNFNGQRDLTVPNPPSVSVNSQEEEFAPSKQRNVAQIWKLPSRPILRFRCSMCDVTRSSSHSIALLAFADFSTGSSLE